jgi:microsomal dipeptidase-like Zn-dependent dipeptidase
MAAHKPTTHWEDVHQRSTIVDIHAHPSLKVSLLKRPLTSRIRAGRAFDPFSVRTDFVKLREGGVDVLLSAVYAPEKGIYEECPYVQAMRFLMPGTWKAVYDTPPFQVTWRMLDEMEQQVEAAVDRATGQPLAKLVTSVRELDELLAQERPRPIAVIHNVEGAHSLEDDVGNVRRLFDRGVAYLTLAHFYPNQAVYPTFPYPESVQKMGCFDQVRDLSQGLEPFGEQVIEEMIDVGMILDLAHCTPPARRRIYDIVGTRAPLIASHVGAYEVNPSPYNLKDWEIKQIADTGGVVGVIFMNYWLMPHETKRGLNFIARTLEQFVRAGGIDHVAIGTDFDGFTDPPDDLKDASELHRLTQRLIAEAYTDAEIEKIWGGNALRVLRGGWGRQV